jgi:hypothetical protein
MAQSGLREALRIVFSQILSAITKESLHSVSRLALVRVSESHSATSVLESSTDAI